ncbi:DUF2989 domain-containing protein [Shewanella oneidensis MR-1]|uniref:DUF2989 domain-containing protein n=1 Tax=Shewanella oneidensis (strain ATCC 700550 / JCM 31522 / CIP 106686 / LMG 19005 / NCIMB 14063 / MR-1) TaxID=211586 RepID=Q8EEN2_SHEON|nr:DUF2989 domain-containing protein [Shewanella oneidensis]AAN55380.1 lipoprotein of unknown function DUF2989 [Shewanella oneidensis MR-1]MDX5995955.1 DUF2989 domain-containing protein [Shewanella oneidensis]MEE2029513.1 hypothetical protein [Shewanella oneidensis]QKG96894.1 DUF2989 domain-containing protein [Shewanella oneidensis MR-1]
MRRNLVIITSFALVMSLFGCDNGRNIQTICKNNPEICADLHKDGWCLAEKTKLIQSRFDLIGHNNPTGKQLYQQLTYLEDYSRCIELASGVQHIIHTNRTADRARAFRLSTQNLSQLQDDTRERQDPFMSYYQWTRFGDTQALNRLLAQESAGEVTEPFLLAQIATYYSSRNAIKAQQLYLKVFASIQFDDFDPSWLLGLASTYRQTQQLDKTYMLTKANLLLTQQKYSEDKMLALIGGNKTLAVTLDQYAQNLIDALKDGHYSSSPVAQWLTPQRIEVHAPVATEVVIEKP